MSDSEKWKKGLLSSNVPLEYEAAKILVSKKFTVTAGYPFYRNVDGISRNFAVSIQSYSPIPFSKPDHMKAKLEVPVTCKHRHPDSVWLFMPNLNATDSSARDYGNVIRTIDKFSHYAIESKAPKEFNKNVPVCSRGIEINLTTGDYSDTELRHGLAQMQYALPRIFTENILHFMFIKPDDNVPFLVCPILLTNIRLFVANKDFTDSFKEDINDIGEIADPVPYLVMIQDYGPDFEMFSIEECNKLKELERSDKAMIVEQKRARYYENAFFLPFTIIESLATGDHYFRNAFFTQFIVCSKSHFGELIEKIKKVAISAVRTRKMLT